jgi:hypothetical protein
MGRPVGPKLNATAAVYHLYSSCQGKSLVFVWLVIVKDCGTGGCGDEFFLNRAKVDRAAGAMGVGRLKPDCSDLRANRLPVGDATS